MCCPGESVIFALGPLQVCAVSVTVLMRDALFVDVALKAVGSEIPIDASCTEPVTSRAVHRAVTLADQHVAALFFSNVTREATTASSLARPFGGPALHWVAR